MFFALARLGIVVGLVLAPVEGVLDPLCALAWYLSQWCVCLDLALSPILSARRKSVQVWSTPRNAFVIIH